MPDIRSLEVFFWVAQLQSFRAASERLHTTQPAISQRVSSLEQELGVKLFNRTSRSVNLTAKGRELLDYAERMLRLRAEMMGVIAKSTSISGILRLGVAETIVHTWLSRFIEVVHALFPQVVLDIEVDVTPNLQAGLASHEIDLAFLLGSMNDPDMTNHPLCSYGLAVIASPNLEFPDRPLGIADLAHMPIITYPKTTQPYIILRQMLSRSDVPPPRIFSCSALSTIVRMTLDGIGVSVIPPAVIKEELSAGKLRVLNVDLELPRLNFTASYHTSFDNSLTSLLAHKACELAEQAQMKV